MGSSKQSSFCAIQMDVVRIKDILTLFLDRRSFLIGVDVATKTFRSGPSQTKTKIKL